MKLISKIAIFGFLLYPSAKSVAQCTPDNTIQASQGIFPYQIEPAQANVTYNQVVQFKAPLDTNVFYAPLNTTVSVRIDSIRITGVLGLPPGITYQCNNASCMINGGEVGCLLISGTTSEMGGHPLKVIVRTSAKIKGTPPFPDIPQVSTDTNTRYDLFVNWPTGLFKTTPTQSLKIYPNPASHTLYIEADLSSEKSATAIVYNITGQAVLTEKLNPLLSKQALDISILAKGFYSVSIVSEHGIKQQKLMVE
jgi:hypothetical protein